MFQTFLMISSQVVWPNGKILAKTGLLLFVFGQVGRKYIVDDAFSR
jgi:hypothetical protein